MGIILTILSFLFSVFCVGVVISLIVVVPLAIYSIPYALWCGTLNGKRLINYSKKEPFFKTVKNATILYKSWILKKEPKF